MCFFPQTFTASIPQMIERASCKLYLETQLLREFGWDSFSLDKAMVLRHSLWVKRHPSTLQEEIWNGKWPWRFSRRRDWDFVNWNISYPPLRTFLQQWDVKSGREMESEIVKRQLAFPMTSSGSLEYKAELKRSIPGSIIRPSIQWWKNATGN